MNDEMKFSEEELESMADKLLEQASSNDIASQDETELPKPRKRAAKKKESAEPPKSPEQVLQSSAPPPNTLRAARPRTMARARRTTMLGTFCAIHSIVVLLSAPSSPGR